MLILATMKLLTRANGQKEARDAASKTQQLYVLLIVLALTFGGEGTCFLGGQQNISLKNSVKTKCEAFEFKSQYRAERHLQ